METLFGLKQLIEKRVPRVEWYILRDGDNLYLDFQQDRKPHIIKSIYEERCGNSITHAIETMSDDGTCFSYTIDYDNNLILLTFYFCKENRVKISNDSFVKFLFLKGISGV